MEISYEFKKEEAIKRMKQLQLHTNVIQDFIKDNKLNKSEHGGILYWLNDKEKEMIKKIEVEKNILVYHVIHNYTEFGELYSLLYISNYEEDWEYDNESIKNNLTYAYVININEPLYSEFGSIGIESQFGGLKRTY